VSDRVAPVTDAYGRDGPTNPFEQFEVFVVWRAVHGDLEPWEIAAVLLADTWLVQHAANAPVGATEWEAHRRCRRAARTDSAERRCAAVEGERSPAHERELRKLYLEVARIDHSLVAAGRGGAGCGHETCRS
jgi:hypothetical protein